MLPPLPHEGGGQGGMQKENKLHARWCISLAICLLMPQTWRVCVVMYSDIWMYVSVCLCTRWEIGAGSWAGRDMCVFVFARASTPESFVCSIVCLFKRAAREAGVSVWRISVLCCVFGGRGRRKKTANGNSKTKNTWCVCDVRASKERRAKCKLPTTVVLREGGLGWGV